jgi:hypothetical protein
MNCPHCQAVMTEKDASTGRCPACGGELNAAKASAAAPASQPAAQANPASSPPAKPPEAKPASTSSPASSASRPAGRPRAESTFGQTASVCLYWLATWVLLAVVLGGGLWLKVWDPGPPPWRQPSAAEAPVVPAAPAQPETPAGGANGE